MARVVEGDFGSCALPSFVRFRGVRQRAAIEQPAFQTSRPRHTSNHTYLLHRILAANANIHPPHATLLLRRQPAAAALSNECLPRFRLTSGTRGPHCCPGIPHDSPPPNSTTLGRSMHRAPLPFDEKASP